MTIRKVKILFLTLLVHVAIMAAPPVKTWGQLQVKGHQLCSASGEPVVLRGVSLGWHNLWPRFYNAKCVKWLRDDWHCTVVRAAMGVCIEDNYKENPEFALECMNKVIRAAIRNNIYVIIDWHTYYPEKEEAVKFFGMMAQKYGKYPHVIYEIYNEPMEDTWESVKDYAHDVITEIRKYDPDNIILVGNPHWDQDLHLVAESPLKGFDNIMYSLHFYAATHGQGLRDRAEAAWKQGIPIFVNESAGMECTGDGPLNVEEWQRWTDWMEDHQISWINWSISDKNETCSMLIPRAKKGGHWKDDVIKPYGKLVREHIRRYNASAQPSLDDLDRESWVDAQSPLDIGAYSMKRIPTAQVTPVGNDRALSLSGVWTLSNNDGEEKIQVSARVPGSIHRALMEANIIPDPTIGKNALMAERCSYRSWALERTFTYDGTMTNPLLSFKGIANKCKIWLNGTIIGEHEGMFGGPDIAVEQYLHKGTNHIKVELAPIPQTYNGGWPATANEAWKHTVVANCVYGWHYSKIPSMGIWDDVIIRNRPTYRMENPFVITRNTNGDMRVCVDFPRSTDGEIRLLVTPTNFEGKSQAFKADINGAKGMTAFDFHVDNPCLWWPNDKGSQPLYRAELQLVRDGKTVASCSRRFGIRTIHMKPFPEGPRKDLYNWTLCINGQEMFVKGTGWCTMDALLDFSYDRYQRFLSIAKEQHVQLIRAWGGGLPETDTFYDLCDELGIMVFQEWPTAWNSHETQPYDMLRETVERNTLRLRNHPSLMMWGGGNESDKPFGKAIDMMGRLSVELDGTRPFHRAEAWGGSRHDYTCWWDGMHLNHNLNMTARFWGEFGIPSLPHAETVSRYLDGEAYVWPSSPESTLTYHTPIFGTNGEIWRLEQYAGYFMPTTTLDNLIFGSQLAQVVGVRHTLERARCLWPHTTGALYYKMNDNFPGLSWSCVDYDGAIKPLHYFARRAFEPVQTVLLMNETNLSVRDVSLPYYLLDDNRALEGKSMTARVTVWNHRMECVADTSFSFVPTKCVEKIGDVELSAAQTTSEMLYLKTELTSNNDGVRVARNWYFANYETRKGVILESEPAEVTISQQGNRVTISNLSDHPAVGVTLSAPGQASTFMPADNYLWLDPHETVTITINREPITIDWWNKKRL